MTSRRLRLAMIGGGPGSMIGPIHRIAARLDDRYELVAAALSSDPARSAQGAEECRIPAARSHLDWRDLIAHERSLPPGQRADVIAVITPNNLHAGPVVAALEAGFNVLCEKPMAATSADAEAMARAAQGSAGLFALAHCYTGYPMVRQMRAMIAAGALGPLRLANVAYAQEWLAAPLEAQGNKQAAWRTDPAQAGVGGALGDIGTHAYNLACFVTGLQAEAICADLSAFGAGRTLDDNVNMLLRYGGGARGTLWASQVAHGKGNQLRIGVWGERAGVEWDQESPNQLRFTPAGEPTRTLERGGADGGFGGYSTRLPGHHPEGYLEAFAQIYSDFAELILAREENRPPSVDAALVPGMAAGLDGMRFIEGAVASHRAQAWLARDQWATA